MQGENQMSEQSGLLAKEPSYSSIFLGRAGFKPKKADFEKALQSCLLQAGITPSHKLSLLFFLSHKEPLDMEKLRRSLFLKNLTFWPLQPSILWQALSEHSKNEEPAPLGVAMFGGPSQVMRLRRSVAISFRRFLPGIMDEMKRSVLESAQRLLGEDKGPLLIQEKAGKFIPLDNTGKTKKLLESNIQEKKDDELFTSLSNPFEAGMLGWGVGALKFEPAGQGGLLTYKMPVVKDVLDWGYLTSLAASFEAWLESHKVAKEACEEYWLTCSSPILSAVLGKILVTRLGIPWEALVFPDIIYGINPLGSCLLFLSKTRSQRAMILLEEGDEVRFAYAPRS